MNLIDMRTAPPRHMWKTWDRRTLPLTHVVVHHSATSPDTSIYEIAFYHVNNKGMPAIQYHYVITPDGKVCWMNDDGLVVWHAGCGYDDPRNANSFAIGVCLVGDFTRQRPPEAQLRAARELVAHLEAKHGRRLDVIGHKEAFGTATACPGDTWHDWKEELQIVETHEAQARILLQTQSANYPDWLVDHARRLGGCQLINPWRGAWWKFRDAGVPFVLGRYVAPNDADNALVAQGARGAEIWFRDWFWPNASRCPGISIWSGHNEQPAFNEEQARAQDAFVSRLADLYHDHGLQLVAYRVSTHHWEYGLWQYFGESLAKVDYLARNSYAYGDRFDLHDADGLMRLVKDVEAIRRYGHRVPPCILTEIGYDSDPSLGIGHRGWRTRGIDAETYTTELIHALLRLSSAVPELVFMSPFLWQAEDPAWETFVLDQCGSELLVAKAEVAYGEQALPSMPAEPPLAEIVAEAQAHIIPRTPGWALYEAGKARGYYEASGEFDVGDWRCQAFRDPADATVQRIGYCRVGDWGSIRWVTVDNATHDILTEIVA